MQQAGARRQNLRKDLGRLGSVRIVCFQQVALDLLRLHRLSDGLSEGALPFRIHGRAAQPQPFGHQADYALHERVQAHGYPGARARYQRIAQQLLLEQGGDVRFGLAAVKGVGEAAVESIVAERNKNGKFKDIYDSSNG